MKDDVILTSSIAPVDSPKETDIINNEDVNISPVANLINMNIDDNGLIDEFISKKEEVVNNVTNEEVVPTAVEEKS